MYVSSISILPDLQTVFGHLQESKLQFYTPDNFWKNFKLYGQPINVREQRDALEFFNDLIDQVDEILKVLNLVEKLYNIRLGIYEVKNIRAQVNVQLLFIWKILRTQF